MHRQPKDARRIYDREPDLAARGGWYHSFELPGGARIEGFISLDRLQERWRSFPLPASMDGKRLLDIGSWDGWFSFEAARRGAIVTAVDCVEIPNFLEVRRRLGAAVDYRILDLYDLPQSGLGAFDYVLFLGVLYHVRHPLLALEIVCSLTRDTAIVDSFVIDGDDWRDHDGTLPVMEFYETDELGGHLDNWFGPSVACLMAMCRAAGFARVELISAQGERAAVACYRHWEPPPEHLLAAPALRGACHHRNFGMNFDSRRDEYVTWFFESGENVTRQEIRAEIGGFGVPCVSLRRIEGGWQANTPLARGLAPGMHRARLRTVRSAFSDAVPIAVDLPAASEGLHVAAVCDGFDWTRGEVRLRQGAALTAWIRGLAANSDCHNVRLSLGEAPLPLLFLGEPDERGYRQLNAGLPQQISPGEHRLTVRFAGREASFPVRIRGPG